MQQKFLVLSRHKWFEAQNLEAESQLNKDFNAPKNIQIGCYVQRLFRVKINLIDDLKLPSIAT